MGKFFRFGKRCRCAPSVVWLLTLLVTANAASTASANQKLEELAKRVGVRILADATSDREVLATSRAQIPFTKMSPRSQQRASHILSNLSQYRRMPCLQYEVNPGMYQYLINHPDVGISTWRVMGISKLQMFQTAEFEYEASAADGSKGIADVLWRDANQCLFIVQGSYSSPMLPGAIEASALVWLRFRFVDSNDGKVLVNQQVETFITFPSHAVDTLAKFATMITNTILDRNVFEVSLYARMMSSAAAKEPEWIEQVAQRMDGVLPQRRWELVQVARGRDPDVGKMLPTVDGPGEQPVARLRGSGAFRAFETSLHQVNTHVPLVAGDVQHVPSYGKRIGESNPYMTNPHQYMPVEARKALAIQQERMLKTKQYNEYYANPAAKGVPVVGSPTAVPPPTNAGRAPELADAMTELPSLSYKGTTRQKNAHGKAFSGGVPVSPSTPLRKSTVKAVTPGRSATNLNAKPVSRSQPLTTDDASIRELPPVKEEITAAVPPATDTTASDAK